MMENKTKERKKEEKENRKMIKSKHTTYDKVICRVIRKRGGG